MLHFKTKIYYFLKLPITIGCAAEVSTGRYLGHLTPVL